MQLCKLHDNGVYNAIDEVWVKQRDRSIDEYRRQQQTESKTKRQRQTDRQTDTERHRQTQTDTERQRDRQRQRDSESYKDVRFSWYDESFIDDSTVKQKQRLVVDDDVFDELVDVRLTEDLITVDRHRQQCRSKTDGKV